MLKYTFFKKCINFIARKSIQRFIGRYIEVKWKMVVYKLDHLMVEI